MVVCHCANRAHFDIVGLYPHSLQLLSVAQLEVDVPFRLPFGYGIHVESCFGKLLIYFLSHLEVVERYTRAYHAMQLFGFGMIGDSHSLDSFLGYSCHCASPSCMHRCHCMVVGVIYNNRYAVGSRYSYAYTAHVGHHGIHAFEYHLAYIVGKMHEILSYLPHHHSMSLVRHHEMSLINAQFITQQTTVGDNVGRVITAIFIDVERGVFALALATVTSSGEGKEMRMPHLISTYHHRPPLRIQNPQDLRCPQRPLYHLHTRCLHPHPQLPFLRQISTYPYPYALSRPPG